MLRIRSIAVALAVFVAAPAAAIPLSDIDASTVIASLDGNATFTDFLAIDPPRSSQFHEITATDTGFLIEATGGTSLISSDDLLLYWGVSFSATNDVAGRRALIRVTGEAADPGADFGGTLRTYAFGAIVERRDVFREPILESFDITEGDADTTIEGSTTDPVPGAFDFHLEVFADGSRCSFCDPPFTSIGRVTSVELAFVPEPGIAVLALVGLLGLARRRD